MSEGQGYEPERDQFLWDQWRASTHRTRLIRTRIITYVAVAVPALLAIAVIAFLIILQDREMSEYAKSVQSLGSQSSSLAGQVSTADTQVKELENLLVSNTTGPLADDLRAKLPEAIDKRTELTDQAADVEQRFNEAFNNPGPHEPGFLQRWILISAIAAVAILFAVALASGILYYLGQEARRRFENELLADEATATDVDTLDLPSLWTDNRDRLGKYHQIVLNFAQSTRQATLLTISIGFFFIVVISIISVTSEGTASAISSSVIGASGAILTGFIGQAVLKNAATSSRELTSFFSHPIGVERALNAERIIAKIEDPQKRAAGELMLVEYLTSNKISAPKVPTDGPEEAATP